jgi:DNA repair protein RecN (Recombination protein N)
MTALKKLLIENYGLIDRAEIEFADGATIFTGETGTGKTMLVGALSFALGARADAEAVGRGAEKASVTLTIDPDEALLVRLNEDGFALDPGEEATILREITRAGKSSLRLCGRPSTASHLREIATHVADVVGQHEAQHLLSPAYHLTLMDRFAGRRALELRAAVEAAYDEAGELRAKLVEARAREQSALSRYEDARFALDEIVATAPQPGEDERLNARRRYLDNVERVALSLRSAKEALGADEMSASSALGVATSALQSIASVTPELGAMAAQTGALQSEVNELAASISGALEATEYDPAELEQINERLDALDRLKRKYGGTIEAAIAHAAESERVVADYEQRGERDAELAGALSQAEQRLSQLADDLSAVRKKAARALEKRVREEFSDLALGSGTFEAVLEPLQQISRSGGERAEFTFSANAGETPRPLARVASGGELSRVLLALVVSLSQARDRDTLVFDEIDAGVGGATAVAVGSRIGRLARDGQVVCVTHLAQIATWAQRHYVLEKVERRGATVIGVREVANKSERANEIARMLSGEPREAALRHARELLAQVH